MGQAVDAFRRLTPAEHGLFLAMIEPLLGAEPAPVLELAPGQAEPPPNLADATKAHIERVIADSDGSISEAARKLGIYRSTLQRKLRRTRDVADVADPVAAATETKHTVPPVPPANSNGRRPRDWLRETVHAVLADGRARTLTEVCMDLAPRIAPAEADRSSVFGQLARMISAGLVSSEGARQQRRYSLCGRSSSGSGAVAKPTVPADPDPEPERAPAAPVRIATITPIRAGHAPRPQAVKPATPAHRPEFSRVRDKDAPPVDIHAIYSRDVKRVKLLTPADEIRLAKELAALELELWKILWDTHRDEAIARLGEVENRGCKGTARRKVSSATQARKNDLDRSIATAIMTRWAASLEPDAPIPEDFRRALSLARQADRVRDAFASANLRLVLAFIKRRGYDKGTALDFADLVQEGNLGLMHAIPRYDPSSGNKFNTYAGWWIRHHVMRARQNMGSDVRQPVHAQELATRVTRTRNKIEAALGRHATDIEIAHKIASEMLQNRLKRAPTQAEIEVEAKPLLSRMAGLKRHPYALRTRESMPIADSVGGDDEDAVSTFASDTPLPVELVAIKADREALQGALALLPDLLADVIRRRYGLGDEEPMKLREIGQLYGVSRERIRQLEVAGLRELRHALRRYKRAA